jgi:hypothetical protein
MSSSKFSKSESSAEKDRRIYKRIRLTPLFVEPIQIKVGNNDKIVPGIMADLSSAGVAIITYGKILCGENITINLNLQGLASKQIKGKVLKVREDTSTYLVVILFDALQKSISKHLELVAMDFEDCETKWTRGDFNFCFKECTYYPYCSKSVKKEF